MEWSLAVVALAVLAVAAVSGRIAGTPITPAMLFVGIGLLVGPKVLDELDLASTSSTVQTLAEATLALVLFSDASRINLRKLRRDANVPLRLLGIGLPLTIALRVLAAADVQSGLTGGRDASTLLLEEIGYGIVGGVLAGLIVFLIVRIGGRRHLIEGAWLQVIPAAGAALAYGIAIGLHGSGFIAAFVAGGVFGGLFGREPGEINRLVEEVGSVLNGVTFLIFGAVLLGPALGDLSWDLVLYAVLSLTVVRMLPVAIAMLGTKARPATVAFMGWFGPRGLASIVFALIVLEECNLPHERTILLAIYLTVGLSVFAHGITAAPLAGRYGRWYAAHPR